MFKRFNLKITKLLNEVYNQIFFPKDDLDGYSFRYGLTAILVVLLLEFIYFFHLTLTVFLLLALLFISINSFLSNLRSTIILIIISLLIVGFYFVPHTPDRNFLEIIIFTISSIVFPLIITLSKRADLGKEWGRREKNYIKQMEKLEEEKNKVIEEIKIHDEFISIASHELKTPLTSTLLKLQAALDNIRNVSLANFSIQSLLEMLESAEQQSQTLAKMINDLLNVSLIRNGQVQLELEHVDLSKMVANIVKRFSEKAKQEQIEIQTSITPDIDGFFDRIKIEQVLSNLLTNAIKYGNHKPIFVKATKDDQTAHISVRDSGFGISKDIQSKIFNLFERGNNHQNRQGLGIGLFISNQIIRAHKGKILLKSQPDKGSVFTIELPLKK